MHCSEHQDETFEEFGLRDLAELLVTHPYFKEPGLASQSAVELFLELFLDWPDHFRETIQRLWPV